MIPLAILLGLGAASPVADGTKPPAGVEVDSTDDPEPASDSSSEANDEADPDLEAPPPAPRTRHRARELFSRAEAAYARGDYLEAADRFSQAYDLAPHGYTLYNLGLAQVRSGDPVAAWHTFSRLEQSAETASIRADAQAQLEALRARIAVVRIDVGPSTPATVDGASVDPGPTGARTAVIRPGMHRVAIGRYRTRLHLRPGETRILLAPESEASPTPDRSAAVPALFGVALVGTAAAAGTGLGAALAGDHDLRVGLGIGSAVSGGVALATGIAALVLQTRRARKRRRR